MLTPPVLKPPGRIWILSFLTVVACAGLQEPKQIHIVVREKPREVLSGKAHYQLLNAKTGIPIAGKSGTTNELGYFLIEKDKKPFEDLMVAASFQGKQDTIRLNKYVGYYDLYLGNPAAHADPAFRVSDMHYHVSMKSHNAFGQHFYRDLNKPVPPPTNINWLKIRNKLLVYHAGKWKKPVLQEDISKESDLKKMKAFLESRWVRSKEGANHLKNFTEATHPHILEGNVFLAFNAISPFEHSVSNDFVKKLVSSGIKSGASFKWLTIMGRENTFLTHWSNFNHEYAMIKNQDESFNNFEWSHLGAREHPASKLNKPLVVNVVEGGHILQDRYFPHFINFDLMDSTNKAKRDLYNIIQHRAENIFHDTALNDRFKEVERQVSLIPNDQEKDGKVLSIKNRFVNTILLEEMYKNIDSLKKMDIHMISIAHLSYNGLTGHAPALDVSLRPWTEWIISKVAQRAYSIRVSSDKNYRLAFDGLFYRVPGANSFGDSVMNRLLDISKGERRIHIDLKHGDVLTRRLILKKYDDQSQKGTPMAPICSHCAVNGLSIDYSSPLLNEYRLLKSSLARKFYPFAINLFNEEIKTICARDGIIGIPLEERVLGGYLNNKHERPVCLKRKNGRFVAKERPFKMKRYKYIKRGLLYLRQENNPEYRAVADYYSTIASTFLPKNNRDRAIRELIYEEYCSAESFLQNVFHVVDIAHTVEREIIADRLSQRYKQGIQDTVALKNVKKISSQVAQLLEQTPIAQKTPGKRSAWNNVCIGSDFDGLIDPLNICPTASQFPEFKEKLKVMIPLFLVMRKEFERNDRLLGAYKDFDKYFDTVNSSNVKNFTLQNALDALFYTNLKSFTQNNFQP